MSRHSRLRTAVLPVAFALLVACSGSSSPAAPTPQPVPSTPIVEGIYEFILGPGKCEGLPAGLTAGITSSVMLSAAGAGWTGREAEERDGRFELRVDRAPQGAASVTGTLAGTIASRFSGTSPGSLPNATIAEDAAARLSGVLVPGLPTTFMTGDVEGRITVADSGATYNCSSLFFTLRSQ